MRTNPRSGRPSWHWPRVGPLRRVAAWLLVLAAFAGGFGASVVVAVQVFVTDRRPNDKETWWGAAAAVAREAGGGAVLVALTMLLVRHLGVTKGYFRFGGDETAWSRRWRRELTVGVFVLAGAWVSFALAALTASVFGWKQPQFPAPPVNAPSSDFYELASSALAGVREEPLFCILIPLALLAARVPLWAAVTVSAALRVSFHIYYGPTAVWLALWATLAVFLVLRTGAIWGVIIMHSLWDIQISAHSVGPPLVGQIVTFVFLAVWAAPIAAASIENAWQRIIGRTSEVGPVRRALSPRPSAVSKGRPAGSVDQVRSER